MRIALAGKGGAGKTTISATLARVLARRGATVVAIDGDANPNLGPALGIEAGLVAAAPFLPASLVSRKLHGPALTATVEDVMGTHAVTGPDGVRLVVMGAPGHAEEGCMCSAHATVAALLGDLGARTEASPGSVPTGHMPTDSVPTDYVTIVDMEASPEHLSRGTVRSADVLLLVTEPYYRSLETVKRLAALAAELPIPRVGVVVNKVRSASSSVEVGDFCERYGLERMAEIPWSDDVVAADLLGVPLLDASPDGPAVAAISALAERLDQFAQPRTAPGGA